LLLAPIIFVLSSCYYTVSYTYYVRNNADSTIGVCYQKFAGSDEVDTLLVEQDSLKVFRIITRTQRTKKYLEHDVKEGVISMTVYKGADTSIRDFKSGDTWRFDRNLGTYTTTVFNADFQK
jgi:hypothetical protein